MVPKGLPKNPPRCFHTFLRNNCPKTLHSAEFQPVQISVNISPAPGHPGWSFLPPTSPLSLTRLRIIKLNFQVAGYSQVDSLLLSPLNDTLTCRAFFLSVRNFKVQFSLCLVNLPRCLFRGKICTACCCCYEAEMPGVSTNHKVSSLTERGD